MSNSAPPEKAKAGRPRSFDRAAALETAMLLFWERGYEGVSIADLTSAIGIAAPSLYAAFTSKAALYREALAHYYAHEPPRPELPAGGTAVDAVRALLDQGVRVVTRRGRPRGCMIGSGFLACAPEHADLAAETRALRLAGRNALRARLAQGVATGELAADADPAALTGFILTVLQGMSVRARDGATVRELEAIARTALAALPVR